MQRGLQLRGTIARNQSVDPEDTLQAKRVLSDLGYYRIPQIGLTPWPDEALFQGISRFQRAEGLPDDGVLEPGGAAVKRLSGAAGRRWRREQGKAAKKIPAADGKSKTASGDGLGAKRRKETIGVLRPGQRQLEVHAKKGISIDAESATLGVDGVRYTVDWFHLNENGAVIPEYRRTDHRPEQSGGHVIPFVASRRDFIPTAESPHGYLFVVTVPPQPAYHGNSAGVGLNIFALE